MFNQLPPVRAIRIHADDDVLVALDELKSGEPVHAVGVSPIVLRQNVPKGHKIAIRAIPRGAALRKYGATIGTATADIAAGDWVHEHNLASALSGMLASAHRRDTPCGLRPDPASRVAPLTFAGYRRSDGRVGTRNEIWIIPTVGCVARTAERIALEADRRWRGQIDGVHAFAHPLGCSQLGDDLSGTKSLLAALAQHPNAAGVLIVGLGCESNQLDALLRSIPQDARARVRSFNAQQLADEVEAGLEAVDRLVRDVALGARREPCALQDLRIGLKCGGSDAFSGVTANPLLGRIADVVTDAGGAAILTEIPELFGAEALLAARATDALVAGEFEAVVNDFRRYYLDHGQPLDANPSPGNRSGGITTLEEKSLGAVQKGGAAALTEVVRYGQRATRPGLNVLEAPGNDAISSTALAAAGATLVLFTTGRGTPLGCPVPTLKVSSNSALATAKSRWIDFDAGRLLDAPDPERLAAELLELVLATASGQPARNELNDERGIAIWKRGVTL